MNLATLPDRYVGRDRDIVDRAAESQHLGTGVGCSMSAEVPPLPADSVRDDATRDDAGRDDAGTIAQRLLATTADLCPHLSLEVVAALKTLVDEHKYQDPQRALQIAQCANAAAALLADDRAIALAAWAEATAHVYLFQLPQALAAYRRAEAIYLARGAVDRTSKRSCCPRLCVDGYR